MAFHDSKISYLPPGPQDISVNQVIDDLPFLSDVEWEKIRTKGDFDYVVVGSSFCALGFVSRVLENTPNAKILIIERGDYVKPKRLHDLGPLELSSVEKKSETFHWEVSADKDGSISYVRGMNNMFGGRSSFWKAWCPKPQKDEMTDWPPEMIDVVQEYFPHAKKLLNVQPVKEISVDGIKAFGKLQDLVYDKLASTPGLSGITRVEHAPLAIMENKCRNGDHMKYSALGPLLDKIMKGENVKAVVHCLVKKICHKDGKAESLETNKGEIHLGNAKLILAMSTLPSTTLMLNSFSEPQLSGSPMSNIGKRFSAHFVSYTYARFPFDKTVYAHLVQGNKLEMAAMYIAGNNSLKRQFHIQLTAVAVIENTPIDTMRNLLKAPSVKQLATCEGHIVFVCASLGQLDHNNSVELIDSDTDITCNVMVRVGTKPVDIDLWDTMDNCTYSVLERLTPAETAIQYWNSTDNKWTNKRPPPEQIRSDGVVHPSSSMWIGGESTPVNIDFQFHGVSNVYLTGGALWPTGASWNPTCTMTALAMNLADKLQ